MTPNNILFATDDSAKINMKLKCVEKMIINNWLIPVSSSYKISCSWIPNRWNLNERILDLVVVYGSKRGSGIQNSRCLNSVPSG